jgi:predicted deacylase
VSASSVYPIEVDFPDLAPYRDGNTGVAYIHTSDSGVPGPHVMINALTHGNEVCGAIVVKGLLDHDMRPRRGRLTLSFANVEAYRRFDPANPDKSRFVEQDFNRIWTRERLDDTSLQSVELRRARELRPLVDTVDLLLDLHSMHERSAPLTLSGPLAKGIALARRLGSSPTIVSDEGHPEGRRLRDYDGFGDAASPRNALLVECGQHWEAAAVAVGKDITARFLLAAGIIEGKDVPHGWLSSVVSKPRIIRVTHAVVARSMDFRFAGPYTGLETFADAGTVVAWNDREPVVTPYANCVLVMPSLRQLRPGVTVVRFGRLVDEDAA